MLKDESGCVRCKDMLVCNNCQMPITDNYISWQMSYPPHPVHSHFKIEFDVDGEPEMVQFREPCEYQEKRIESWKIQTNGKDMVNDIVSAAIDRGIK